MLSYYWDACCFISRIQRDPEHIVALEYITDEAAADRVTIVTSTLSIAEVSCITREATLEEVARDAETIARFFDNPYIVVRQVTRRIAEHAAAIGREFGVKPPDAIHLATAIEAGVQIVHTYDDKKLLKLDGKVGTPPLTIVTPETVERQLELFGQKESGGGDENSEPEVDPKIQ